MSARALAANAFWSLLSHLLSRGSLMLSAVILARNLDTASFAAYSYFQLTVSMLAAYAAMGLGVSASKFFAEVGHEKPDADPPPLGTLWALSLILAVGAFALIMLMPGSWLTAGLGVPKWLLATGVLALGLTVVPSGAIIGLERYKQATLISATSGTTMLLMVWWASQNNAPSVAMGAIALAALLQATGESAVVIRTVGWQTIAVGFRLRRQALQRVASLAGPMFFVTLLSASGSWLLGRMILHGEGGEHAFASYVIGLQWFSLGLLLPGIFSRVILPRLVRNTTAESPTTSSKKLVLQGAMMAISAATAIALTGLILGPWILQIYGANYQIGRWFIAAFLGAAVVIAPANTIGNAILAQDGQRTWLFLTVIWLGVLMISGNISASLGAISGAISLAIAGTSLTISALIAARKRQLI